MENVEARMARIMEKYLRPAGFDFQKVANDVDRLRRGRVLYERDPIRTLNNCKDSNERYHALSEFKEYVLPYYDDLGSMAPAIRDCMVSVALAARATPTVPTQYGFDGFTREHILESTLEVIDYLRFRHEGAIEATFDALGELWAGAEMSDETERIIQSARQLAENNLSAWQQVGPLVQHIVVEKVRQLTADQIDASRPLVIAVLNEVLKAEVGGATWNFGSVTIRRGAILPSDALQSVRRSALEVLQRLFGKSEDDNERRSIRHAFNDAMRPPSGPHVDAGLREMMLQDALIIVDFYRGIADELSFELLQSLEHDLLWLRRLRGRPPADLQEVSKIVELRNQLARGIIAFRDQINSDRRFVIYKTLVGFESVFPPMWDADTNIKEEAAYRQSRITELVESVSVENASEWFEIIARCARTKSNDAFPSFGRFLEELAREKPDLTLQLIEWMDDDLARFLPSILKGLVASIGHEMVRSLTDKWLNEPRYLQQIAIFCGETPAFDASLLESAVGAAIANGDEIAVIWAMEVAARQDMAPDELIERVFLPGLRYLASIGDTRWVRAVWPFARKSAVFSSLSETGVDEVLLSLMGETKLGHESEWVLAVIAENWPNKVVDYFIDRLRLVNSNEAPKRFEPVPFSLSKLREPLANCAADMVKKLRAWHSEDDRIFRYRGAQFLKAIFPNFMPLENTLRSVVAEGEAQVTLPPAMSPL